jgi:hypothetical protein
MPVAGVDWARASIDTPLGPASTFWQIGPDGTMEAEVELPFGATGEFRSPVTATSTVQCDGAPAESTLALAPGRHHLTVSSPLRALSAN